jgi:uncharacterized protein
VHGTQWPGQELRVEVATGVVSRTLGLMGRRGMPAGSALLIRPCSSVHTMWMRFAIDVAYLDREERVVKVVHGLRPWRASIGGRRAHSVLELAAGEAARAGIEVGARVRVTR